MPLSRKLSRGVIGAALTGLLAAGVAFAAPASAGDTTAAPEGADRSKCPVTAALTQRWGAPTVASEFNGTTLPLDWHPYGLPGVGEPGHQEEGLRHPDQIVVGGGEATITGDRNGKTGAMSWHPGQQYGRWEICVKTDVAASDQYHAVVLDWPVKEDWPVGGELDWMEIGDADRQDTAFFLHYGPENHQEETHLAHDATKWTAYAVEWTKDRITAYVNGRAWYTTRDVSHFPPRPMNMTAQLDWFPDSTEPPTEAKMHIDWARQWALPYSVPATLRLCPGQPATGQPDLYPQNVPHDRPC